MATSKTRNIKLKLGSMKTIKVTWGVNTTSGEENITLESMGLSDLEWSLLSDKEKEEKLQEALDELPERTCIILDDWKD